MYHKLGPHYRNGYGSGYQLARLVALVSKIQRDSDKSPPDRNDNDPDKNALARYTLSLTIATWVIAGAAILSFGAALLQWRVLKSTDISAERSSTIGRAYIFIKPEFVMEDIKSIGANATRGTYGPSIRFSIKNFGQTPAIITDIKTHLYLTKGMATDDPPEPDSAEGGASVDLGQADIRPTDFINGRSDFMTIDRSGKNPARIVFTGGDDSGSLTATFLFLERRRLQWGWFYCEVGLPRHFQQTPAHMALCPHRRHWFYLSQERQIQSLGLIARRPVGAWYAIPKGDQLSPG